MHIYTEHVVLLVLFFFSPTPLAICRDMQRVHGTMKTSPCLTDHTFRDDRPLKVIANDGEKKKKRRAVLFNDMDATVCASSKVTLE